MEDVVIVLPTHSKYEKIVRIFLQLLRKNWEKCSFRIIVSGTGERMKIEEADDYLYNGKDASLIDCLVNAAKKYRSRYYVSFLGDAFINEKIDDDFISWLLKDLTKNDVEYCSLKYVKNYKRERKYNEYLRYINGLDRYSHNFFAFIASRDFVIENMAKFRSDLEFEEYYLSNSNDFYCDKHLIVRGNYFKLVPGITKGKWDKINYSKLKKKNSEIDFDNTREIQSLRESSIRHIRDRVVFLVPSSARIVLKRFVEKVFKIEFGVKD